MKKSEKYNASGYLDLTAYHALNIVEREEEAAKQSSKQKKRKRKKKRRKSAK